ncbi:MAG: hypothetical protein ACW986_17000 [Promethearchaeota archaeon]|jgi:hypothetical protein
MTVSNNQSKDDWTLEKLQTLTRDECVELFKTLSPPDFEELNGEYAATLLGENLEYGEWFMYKTELGRWLGKAYTPIANADRPGFKGEGYNFWIIDGKKAYHSRFASHMSTSIIDGKPIFRMQYDAFKSFYGQEGMVDEVRKIKNGLYLLFGMPRPTSIPGPVCLAGPTEPYNKNPDWHFGDEVTKPVKIKFSFKEYPYPEQIKTNEFREYWKDHFD